MLPQPVLALFLLYPISANSRQARALRIENSTFETPDIFYMKQTVSNACGTIAALHAIGNAVSSELMVEPIIFPVDSFLYRYFEQGWGLTPEERGRLLEEGDALEGDIENAHQSAASEGQSRVPENDEKVDLHFIAIIPRDGCIYELDGRAGKPINHGPYVDFAKDACARVIKQGFMDVDPLEIRFNILALVYKA